MTTETATATTATTAPAAAAGKKNLSGKFQKVLHIFKQHLTIPWFLSVRHRVMFFVRVLLADLVLRDRVRERHLLHNWQQKLLQKSN